MEVAAFVGGTIFRRMRTALRRLVQGSTPNAHEMWRIRALCRELADNDGVVMDGDPLEHEEMLTRAARHGFVSVGGGFSMWTSLTESGWALAAVEPSRRATPIASRSSQEAAPEKAKLPAHLVVLAALDEFDKPTTAASIAVATGESLGTVHAALSRCISPSRWVSEGPRVIDPLSGGVRTWRITRAGRAIL